MFVDEVKVHTRSGRGGDGVTSFARQPFEPHGRPEGGDGGKGGDVVVRATADVATLVEYHHRPHRAAKPGKHGEGDLRKGADGADEVLLVPVGTLVKDADGQPIADLLQPGEQVIAATGGRGGRGNASFRTSARRAPLFHEFGEPERERWVVLELKLVADVALVGFPNAGKSSVIARLSAAKPKIAGYPFTTLAPNLGVVRTDDVDFVIADVPGLIEGASEGRGLGHRFLRHVERAGVLVHVLDCASYEQRDPTHDLDTVLAELAAYMPDLLERPSLVFANKVDAEPDIAQLVFDELSGRGWEVIIGSAVSGEGLDRLRLRMAQLVAQVRATREVSAPSHDLARPRPVLRPGGTGGRDFTIEVVAEGYRVHGDRVARWVRMTDLENEEAVRYLQGRLARAGVERELVKAGARRGDPVEIAGRVFEFSPDPGELAKLGIDEEDDLLENFDVDFDDEDAAFDRDDEAGAEARGW